MTKKANSIWFSSVSKYYKAGMPGYTDEGLKNFVKADMITEAEYKEITGKKYL